MASNSPIPTPDEIKARIDSVIAKRDLAQLWGIYYARKVGGEPGEELLTEVMERSDQAVRVLHDRVTKDLEEAPERIQEVIGSVRKLWPLYDGDERRWFEKYLPELKPEGKVADTSGDVEAAHRSLLDQE